MITHGSTKYLCWCITSQILHSTNPNFQVSLNTSGLALEAVKLPDTFFQLVRKLFSISWQLIFMGLYGERDNMITHRSTNLD